MGAWVKTSTGIEIPAPAFESGGVTISTLVDSGRDATGKFVGSTIGADKLKIELSWSALSPTQFRDLLKIWDRSQGGKFINTFTVYDPRTMTYREIDMYVGDRQGKPIMVSNPGTGHPKWWLDIQANLIEV